jgi:DNA polymerase
VPTLSECREYIDAYRKFFSKIPKLWREANDSLQYIRDNVIAKVGPLVAYGKAGFLLPSGYSLKYPGLTEDDGDYSYKSRTGKTKIYGGKVVENLTQALARCVISEQMVAVAEKYRPVLTVHDAIAIVVPVKETDAATEYLEKCMSTAPEWASGLPLSCKSKIGETYGG